MSESATLTERDGALLPIEYNRMQKNSSSNKDEHYRFDWKTNSVAIDYHGRQKSLTVPEGAMDLFSLQLKLMQDAASEGSSFEYPVVAKGKLRTYTYTRLKPKKIETALGKLSTVRFERRKEDVDDTVYTLWMAPAQNYLPVRFLSTKNGDEVLTLEIASVLWRAAQDQPQQ